MFNSLYEEQSIIAFEDFSVKSKSKLIQRKLHNKKNKALQIIINIFTPFNTFCTISFLNIFLNSCIINNNIDGTHKFRKNKPATIRIYSLILISVNQQSLFASITNNITSNTAIMKNINAGFFNIFLYILFFLTSDFTVLRYYNMVYFAGFILSV